MLLTASKQQSAAAELARRLPDTVLSFRGYNVTNLGRTPELLAHPAYGPIVEEHLAVVSVAASRILARPVDLTARVRERREPTLAEYGEALALLIGVEAAQLAILHRVFGIDHRAARFAFGFSLGEIGALVAGGILEPTAAITVPLALAEDAVALAHETTLGVLFTRSRELVLSDVERLCLEVNQQGAGVVGISAQLAPNSLLVLGQGDTLDRLIARAAESLPVHVHLRKNDHRWPPLHTPIVWEKQIPSRAARLMHTLPFRLAEPTPPVLSLVTGEFSYSATSARSLLYRWIDQPQKLWDAVYQTLASGATTVLHVGPAPNIVPATFRRLSEDVLSQLSGNHSLRALSAAVRRAWLRRLLPERTALLRAPYVEQIILEDWLLAQAP
jgi:[acyl-carrier-protein] S-malonyltransferase